MTEMKTVSVLLEPETLEQIIQLQKDQTEFSRSKIIRVLIDKGLAELENNKAGA